MSNETTYIENHSFLNHPFKFDEADLPVGTLVKLTGDKTVGTAGSSSDLIIGHVYLSTPEANGKLGGVSTIFRKIMELTLGETVAAGDYLAPGSGGGSGKTTSQLFGKADTQSFAIPKAIALEGGDADDVIEAGFM